ncbi:helicase-exonuclease AddAB subunit AddB [Aneurinibacillus sp. Ricciae_BoGa-3]|uniref:helicase-exonuclease AddAB subunit AddB n=1 Tax=Aneurinibacillus sp. Ricciae_BoGa-3 TaxID=3022697 RepID=UPI0023419D57|nr:helicase-exonuclease AddAB subunit AddB [Aneurinibacillus sp. Ricciae_BoGa-3]WCK56217.1 helicase-exonuclease AddAB subunit AddB [Aneurinibacillus sp. Ricciae_BoGa-3]
MPLRIVTGRAGSGKSTFCMGEIRQELEKEPLGAPLVYIVPQQMSYQAENELAMSTGLNGMMRAEVLSFQRLAYKVLQEVGGLSRIHVDSTGIKMVLRKIVQNRKSELRVFGRAASQTGFTDKLEEMYGELARHCVTVQDLAAERERMMSSMAQGEDSGFLADKLHDMTIIFEELESYLSGRYLDAEHYLPLLAERIPRSAFVSEASFWIDGFDSFTPQEYSVLLALLKGSRKVTVTLCMDKPRHDAGDSEFDVFYTPNHTYSRLLRLAEKNRVSIEQGVALPVDRQDLPRFLQNPALAHLEAQFNARPPGKFTANPEGILVQSAANKRAEIEGAAQRILSLVRDGDYRFRDTAVLVRDMESYADLIETVFTDYQIPFFLDHKRSMLHHPLTELIRSVLEVIEYNWGYESVFRCIKTDFLPAPLPEEKTRELRNRLDRLENYVLAYGIEGYRWTEGRPWNYKTYRGLDQEAENPNRPATEHEREVEAEMNVLRNRIAAPIQVLQRDLHKAGSVRGMCESLYRFLISLDVPERLEVWSGKAVEDGQLDRAREHAQVWQEVIHMLDQLVEVMGDEAVSISDFMSMIESGLESLRFALIPPAVDQVLVGSLDRTRTSNVACMLVLGVTDGVIPARQKDDGMLSDSEKARLKEAGLELSPGSGQKLIEEELMIYRALLSPTRQLYLSYPLADEDGKAQQPAGLIKRIKDMFPLLTEQFIPADPGELPVEAQLTCITNPARTLSYLAARIQQWRRGYPMAPLWWDAYNWIAQHEPVQSRYVLGSLFYYNQERNLKPETSRKIYGHHIKASVSRMEMYKSCPFSQFMSYGLKLKERELYRVEMPDIGQLFHAALRMIGEHMRHEQVNWGELGTDELNELAAETVDGLTPFLQKQVLLSTNRNKYLAYKLKNVVGRAAQVLGEHARRSEFTPLALEMAFGGGGPIPPIVFTLPNGCKMELVGRIDRVDGAVGSQGLLIRVMDYKSSQKGLNLSDIYFGLALQMLTYLDVLVTHSELVFGRKAIPAGVLYFHVHNPIIKTQPPFSSEAVFREIVKSFKMKGLVLQDEEVVRLMDTRFESGYSEILPVAIGKNGFYSNAAVASLEQFDLLRGHTRRMIYEIGKDITDGVVSIAPYWKRKETPCTFCSYKPVCQFDREMPDNDYVVLREEPKETLWEKFVLEGGGIMNA